LVTCHDAKEVVKMMMNLKNEAKLQSIFLLNNFWQERNAVREGGQRRPAESLARAVPQISWARGLVRH
jgi:hypothetical protein